MNESSRSIGHPNRKGALARLFDIVERAGEAAERLGIQSCGESDATPPTHPAPRNMQPGAQADPDPA